MDSKELAQYIDHTQLRPEATEADIAQACAEAREHGFKTVCVERQWVKQAAQALEGSASVPIAVIGFPKGTEPTAEKVEQTRAAVADGAREIDMVLNRDLMNRKDYAGVYQDIHAVVEAAGVPVKVILETSELTLLQKQMGCVLSKAAGAAFVKTSTGFASGGATLEDVRLMRDMVGDDVGVKASGGIRDRKTALAMIEAGASRLGCSASVAIVGAGDAGSEGY